MRWWAAGLAAVALALPAAARAQEAGWSLGAYAGKYHDTEPAGAVTGRTHYLEQYLLAVTASKTVWQAQSLPLALEIDGMLGVQGGLSDLQEVAIAPALRWSGLPGRDTLRADVRFAPLGLSYTSTVSPLERGRGGQGSQWLNWLFVEAAFSRAQKPDYEFFVRLHHRCAIYDLLNDYGANGEDFLALGVRRRF
ncbi:MAG: hypothetical protein HXX19_10495 [Rhodoferax sp.]|nr:hypothetical protein [Rhodoferax sp.]